METTIKQEETYFKKVLCSERLPLEPNENYLTISEKGFKTARFFNGTRFETAHYEGEIIYWLEETALSSHLPKEAELNNDWTKGCKCPEDKKTGAMWCCNFCGRPTSDFTENAIYNTISPPLKPLSEVTDKEKHTFESGKIIEHYPTPIVSEPKVAGKEESTPSIELPSDDGFWKNLATEKISDIILLDKEIAELKEQIELLKITNENLIKGKDNLF